MYFAVRVILLLYNLGVNRLHYVSDKSLDEEAHLHPKDNATQVQCGILLIGAVMIPSLLFSSEWKNFP